MNLGTFTIQGASIVDGTDAPQFRGNLVVKDGVIAEVGQVDRSDFSGKIIDGTGLTLTPGFIDMHSHSDLAVLSDSEHLSKVTQGVTLEVVGQDGLSYAPSSEESLQILREQLYGWNGDPTGLDWNFHSVAEYLNEVDKGAAVNVAYLIPHGSVRMQVRGNRSGLASSDELTRMSQIISQSMVEGAYGLSAGLTYTPGMYANDEELIQLCRTVAQHGGYYAPHHRNYGSKFLDAVEDCVQISIKSSAPLHLTHCHMSMSVNQGRAGELITKLNIAKQNGVDITLDSYPYLAGSSYLHSLLPSWVQEGGKGEMRKRLNASVFLRQVIDALDVSGSDGYSGSVVDWQNVVIAGVELADHLPFVGKSIGDSAATLGIRPVDLYIRIILNEDFKASCIVFAGNESNVREIMRHSSHMVGSDGILTGSRPHPRGYGTFARYLGYYARKENVLTLEGAVARMTGRPAARLGLKDRGLLKVGFRADMVLLDYQSVIDESTYESPRIPASGFDSVWIDGIATLKDGKRTSNLPGRGMRHKSSKPL
jgi:N-acyl-D-amino-acid deacylase